MTTCAQCGFVSSEPEAVSAQRALETTLQAPILGEAFAGANSNLIPSTMLEVMATNPGLGYRPVTTLEAAEGSPSSSPKPSTMPEAAGSGGSGSSPKASTMPGAVLNHGPAPPQSSSTIGPMPVRPSAVPFGSSPMEAGPSPRSYSLQPPSAPCPRCGAKNQGAPMVLVVDGRYRVDSELGRGGMGIVYLATDMGLCRSVALKVISPEWGRDREWTMALQKEAVALASIRSQHVVQVYAFGRHQESHFFAMEYVRGRSLRQILAEHRRHNATIPLHRALTIVARLAEGLDAVHAAGLVHRDVKPDNIVIEEDTGRPVLVDFGLAVPSATLTATFEGGTPNYMAPEQSWFAPTGSVITPRTDVYALGCIAFEMLSGRVPFDEVNPHRVARAHAMKPVPAISSVRADLVVFDSVLRRALSKDPSERQEACIALASALASAGEIQQRKDRIVSLELPPPSIDAISGAHRVLVVDDDPSFLKFATRAVQLAFYGMPLRITAIDSGAAALARAAREPPDLVLLDFDMPGLDGLDTLSRLRALPHGARARVVVLSGKVGDEDRWRFSVLGVNDFVSKPIDLEHLVESITALTVRAGWREREEEGETSSPA